MEILMCAICCCGAGFSLRRASARLTGSETKVPPSRGHRPGKRSEARRRLRPAPQIAISLAALWLASAAGSSAEPLHAYHATKLKIDCSQCHVPVKKDSVTLRRPGHSQCTMCHAMAFRAGNSPEEMLSMWPSLNLAEVHAAIAYALANAAEVEADIAAEERVWARAEAPAHAVS